MVCTARPGHTAQYLGYTVSQVPNTQPRGPRYSPQPNPLQAPPSENNRPYMFRPSQRLLPLLLLAPPSRTRLPASPPSQDPTNSAPLQTHLSQISLPSGPAHPRVPCLKATSLPQAPPPCGPAPCKPRPQGMATHCTTPHHCHRRSPGQRRSAR